MVNLETLEKNIEKLIDLYLKIGDKDKLSKVRYDLVYKDAAKYFNVDLMDAEGPDMVLDIPEGKVIQKNYVGKDMVKYDGMIVLSHFKGHPMGGYGGALKQLSIGCASSYGKAYIHGAGEPEKQRRPVHGENGPVRP